MNDRDTVNMGQPRRALCVSIHDVAPATWSDCLRLYDAVRAVADVPLTWLVVPCFHGSSATSGALDAMLDQQRVRGDELALHGYTHRDGAPTGLSVRDYVLRHLYTQREGEFAAIGVTEARARIDMGLAWFAQRGWRPTGFVAPAWLLGEGAWRALLDFPFAYTTTYRHFHVLPGAGIHAGAGAGAGTGTGTGTESGTGTGTGTGTGAGAGAGDRTGKGGAAGPDTGTDTRIVSAPALVYAARNRVGRLLSPRAMTVMARAWATAPLLRLALHPRDARHPALLRHMQTLLAELLHTHQPMTKAAYAASVAASGHSAYAGADRSAAGRPMPDGRATPGGRPAPKGYQYGPQRPPMAQWRRPIAP